MVEATLNADYNSYIDARFRNTARSKFKFRNGKPINWCFKDSVTAEATKAQALEQKMCKMRTENFQTKMGGKLQEYKDISKTRRNFCRNSQLIKMYLRPRLLILTE